MSQSFHFKKRKSVADFLSENLPNQILHATVKQNTNLPDEAILAAFNEAYAICLDVINSPEVSTARSDSYATMTDGIARSTLVSLAFAYFLLSFHQEATHLRRYLANLKDLLDKRLPDLFHPIYIAATSMSTLIPGTSSFGYPIVNTSTYYIYDPRQFVSIQHVMRKAEERPKEEAIIVLDTLSAAVAEENGDWNRIFEYQIQRISKRPDPTIPSSPYRIREKRMTDFVKIMKACRKLSIFEEENGLYVRNFEKFVIAFGRFFNTEIKHPDNLLSGAKDRNFMKIFDELKTAGDQIFRKGDGLDEQPKRSSRKHSSDSEPELF